MTIVFSTITRVAPVLVLVFACWVAAARAASPAAEATVRDCGYNLVPARPLGSYLSVTSVRNLSCAVAQRRARRARLTFSPPSMRLSGWSCRLTGIGGAGTPDPMPQYRCVRAGRAFRATARP